MAPDDEAKVYEWEAEVPPSYGRFAAAVVVPHGGPYMATAVDHQAHECAPQTEIDMVSPECYSIPDHVTAYTLVVDGELEVNPDTSLTLSHHSRVNGEIVLLCAELFIDANLTISGDGGEIKQKFEENCNSYVKSASGTDYTLTIEPSDTGDNLLPENSLVLTGQLVIDVDLDNDAYVIARRKTLTLQGGEKQGDDGHWMAEKESGQDAGTLDVDVAVTGAGTWEMTSNATIRIDATCTSLTGDFTLSAGTLEINRNLTTTGDLDFSGTAAIKVAELKEANFN